MLPGMQKKGLGAERVVEGACGPGDVGGSPVQPDSNSSNTKVSDRMTPPGTRGSHQAPAKLNPG
jgi:hypothetical protein